MREQILAQSEALLAHPIILDEVQRVPLLLDEVHWLIENKGLRFYFMWFQCAKAQAGTGPICSVDAPGDMKCFPLVTDEFA